MIVRSCFDRFRNTPRLLSAGYRWLDYIQRPLSRATSLFFTLVDEQQKMVDLFRAVQHYTTNTIYFAKEITHRKHRDTFVTQKEAFLK